MQCLRTLPCIFLFRVTIFSIGHAENSDTPTLEMSDVFESHFPINSLCLSRGRGLVSASAPIYFVGQYSNITCPFSTHSRIKWCCISICFVLAWNSRLCASTIAPYAEKSILPFRFAFQFLYEVPNPNQFLDSVSTGNILCFCHRGCHCGLLLRLSGHCSIGHHNLKFQRFESATV